QHERDRERQGGPPACGPHLPVRLHDSGRLHEGGRNPKLASVAWPAGDFTYATNAWATAWFGLFLSTPIGYTATMFCAGGMGTPSTNWPAATDAFTSVT